MGGRIDGGWMTHTHTHTLVYTQTKGTPSITPWSYLLLPITFFYTLYFPLTSLPITLNLGVSGTFHTPLRGSKLVVQPSTHLSYPLTPHIQSHPVPPSLYYVSTLWVGNVLPNKSFHQDPKITLHLKWGRGKKRWSVRWTIKGTNSQITKGRYPEGTEEDPRTKCETTQLYKEL